jgi:hypothetical protein
MAMVGIGDLDQVLNDRSSGGIAAVGDPKDEA